MFDILLIGIICFFAAFGAVQFFDALICQCRQTKNRIISVVPLHNNEADAEVIIRNAFVHHRRVIAVDYGSFDNTLQILGVLKEEFPGLSVFTEDEFTEYLKDYCYVERSEF